MHAVYKLYYFCMRNVLIMLLNKVENNNIGFNDKIKRI